MTDDAPAICQGCGKPTYEKTIHVTMWTASGLIVIEDVPAQVCDECQEQFYDEGTSTRILELATQGFPRDRIVREITVPVYSLPAARPEDSETRSDERMDS